MTPEETAKKFLKYAFDDIDFDYDKLTPRERSICTREEFEKLVDWAREDP